MEVDVSGKRRVPSIRYVGNRGNQTGGGNRYFVIYRDAKTGRLFESFIPSKDCLENDVYMMTRAMEIAAKFSVDYKGLDISVMSWKSDRDSNLTSDQAVDDMMEARQMHRMTASDAKNQTPKLDAAMRQIIDGARTLLVDAGLPAEFWEFAVSRQVSILNGESVEKHPQQLSPNMQWSGRPDDLEVPTFGCDVYLQQVVVLN